MTATASHQPATSSEITRSEPPDLAQRRLSIAFINWAHAIDHFVILIYPTVVIALQAVHGDSYSTLIYLATASFVAFGLFALPAGWLGDHWSRRNMMAIFFFGCGVSLVAAALSPSLHGLAFALFALGLFAAIYHPVGTAMIVENAARRGRTLAFNGVCGNLGVALAAVITAALTAALSWRGAFLVPGAICIATGIAYLWLVPNETRHAAARARSPDMPMSAAVAVAIFALFFVVAVSAGLVFNTISVALPKIVDERISGISLIAVGGLTSAVFLCGAVAQLTVGRLVERAPAHLLFVLLAIMQFSGIVWSAYASGTMLLLALAYTMAAIYGQITVNDLMLAHYSADAWRARIYAVRYFVTFITSGVAVSMIAFLHARGGFPLVLGVTAVMALGFLVSAIPIAILAHRVERGVAHGVERDAKHAVERDAKPGVENVRLDSAVEPAE